MKSKLLSIKLKKPLSPKPNDNLVRKFGKLYFALKDDKTEYNRIDFIEDLVRLGYSENDIKTELPDMQFIYRYRQTLESLESSISEEQYLNPIQGRLKRRN